MTAALAALIWDTDAVLDRAADYLQRHGWTPDRLYDDHSGCTLRCSCHRTGSYPASIIGAIRAAVFGRPRWYLDTADPAARHAYTAAVEWLNTYLIAIGHTGLHAPVFDWQTAPGRTCADVLGALRAAATAYRHHTQRRTDA
jgi:energy-converting hydrogenase Eha subunit A